MNMPREVDLRGALIVTVKLTGVVLYPSTRANHLRIYIRCSESSRGLF